MQLLYIFVGTATKRSITHAFGMDKKGRIHIRTTAHHSHSTTMYLQVTYANTEMTVDSVVDPALYSLRASTRHWFFPVPLGMQFNSFYISIMTK